MMPARIFIGTATAYKTPGRARPGKRYNRHWNRACAIPIARLVGTKKMLAAQAGGWNTIASIMTSWPARSVPVC